MRVALVSSLDARDARSWSGIPYHMMRALEARGHDVVPIGPLAPPELRLAQALALVGRRPHRHTWLAARGFARVASRRLDEARADVALAPAASAEIAALETRVPIVYYSDATFRLLVDYHPAFTGLRPRRVEEGDAIERAAIGRAAATAFPTRWAADSAVRDYGARRDRLAIAPFGANLDRIPSRADALAPRPRDELRMLFLAVNWARKGGDIAADALRELRARGVPATLAVCGCEPPPGTREEGLVVVPAVDKRSETDRRRLDALLARSHLLLLPTRTECAAVAFSEAAAHALPVVSTRTGGVPDVVVEGETGLLLPIDAPGRAYADVIEALWHDPERYARMAAGARARYDERLNWDAWARDMEALFALAQRGEPMLAHA